MLRLGFRPTSRFALGLATFLVGAVGCTAGVQQTSPARRHRGRRAARGSAGAAATRPRGLGGFTVGGRRRQRRPERAARCRSLPAAATASTTRAASRTATTATPSPATAATASATSSPTGTVPRRARCAREVPLRRRHHRRRRGVRRRQHGRRRRLQRQLHGAGSRLRLHARERVHADRRSAGTSASSRARTATTATRPRATAAARACQLETGLGLPGAGLAVHARGALRRRRRERRTSARCATTATSPRATAAPSDCKIKGAGCSCIPGMKCACPEVRCGNGTIEGTEKCDDGNADRQRRLLVDLPDRARLRLPAVAARPAFPTAATASSPATSSAIPGDHHPATWRARRSAAGIRGWACTGNPPTECHATTLRRRQEGRGRGLRRRQHQPFDGCSATCQAEPTCPTSNGVCTGKCGDGMLPRRGVRRRQQPARRRLLGDLQAVEPGYTCTQPPLGDSIQVPVVYRDFLISHPDFEPGAIGPDDADHRPRRRPRSTPRASRRARRGTASAGAASPARPASRTGTATSPASTTRPPPR